MTVPVHSARILPTVSRAFLEDWLAVLQQDHASNRLTAFFNEIGLARDAEPNARISHDQIVRLYQFVAAEIGDEMVGLWNRPVRSGALKHLCESVRGASSMNGALFRFASFWNLVLDDFQLELATETEGLRLSLVEKHPGTTHHFGQALILKLAHGVISWLAGYEVALKDVCFAFDPPEFAHDYPLLFPAPVKFSQELSSVSFHQTELKFSQTPSNADMRRFLQSAPRDWIFTGYREHALPLRVRELFFMSDHLSLNLQMAASMLNVTTRTLIRRLDAEGTSFQDIKDGLRRDIAFRDLSHGAKSIEAISQDLGFASPANFHRAFKRWTGLTPRGYQRTYPVTPPRQ